MRRVFLKELNFTFFAACLMGVPATSCSFATLTGVQAEGSYDDIINMSNSENSFTRSRDVLLFSDNCLVQEGAFEGKQIRILDLSGELPTIEDGAFRNCTIETLIISPNNWLALEKKTKKLGNVQNEVIQFNGIGYEKNNFARSDFLDVSNNGMALTLKGRDLDNKNITLEFIGSSLINDYCKEIICKCHPASLSIHGLDRAKSLVLPSDVSDAVDVRFGWSHGSLEIKNMAAMTEESLKRIKETPDYKNPRIKGLKEDVMNELNNRNK